ncbi:MAG: phosphoribosylamine--glycine ligase [Candidatus Altiarchaeales archaeon]|nr:phosphoribosylamine--glycine ligase [Candidatus Altiarchaeales archaeon]
MNILLVGNGAREHAIIKALSESRQKKKLYSFMSAKNPGIARISDKYTIGDTCKPEEVLKYALENKVDLVVVGPEAPLNAGVVDALEDKGIRCAGPRKIAAQLETDKTFCRSLLEKHKVKSNPKYGIFEDYRQACKYLDSIYHDFVLKPAGLTGGKGVKVFGEHLKNKEEAKEYIKEILNAKVGHIPKVVVEEKLVGEEFTLQAFVDGNRVVGAPMVQDHKRAYEGDKGPNTGGMGSYSDKGFILPFLTERDYQQGLEVMEETVKAVKKETGVEYKGFLYGQFMATKSGVGLIEYNARLGDPEAMNILSILESDFVDICQGMADMNLKKNAKFSRKATVCKYMAPEGYPENPKKDVELTVDENAIKKLGGGVYYASVREENGKIISSKSRSVAVLGVGNTISEAEKVAEKSMQHIKGDLFHRKDIGTDALIQKRIKHMKELRK